MKRNTLVGLLFGLILFAALLGWFGQDIAYYFESHLLYLDPLKMLTIVTVTSVGLFVISFVINTILLAKQKIDSGIYLVVLITNIFIGFFVSLWSLFVLAMWWG